MNKKRININSDELINLIDKINTEKLNTELNRLLDQVIQGKVFFDKNHLQNIIEYIIPILFNIEEIKQPIPLSQYKNFVSVVASLQPELFEKEMEYAQSEIFSKMDHPLKFVQYLDLFYKFKRKNAQKFKELLPLSFNFAEIENLNLDNLPQKNIQVFLIFLKDLRDFIDKKDIKGFCNRFKLFIENQNSYSKEVKTTIILKIDEIIQIIEEQDNQIKEILNDPTEFGRNILRAVNYTQSHIEYFCSHIHCLVHIKNKGNRDYGEKYYQHGSKKFWVKNFITMCKRELNDYKSLQSFLIHYSKELKELRNINAHQVAGEISLSKDYKMLIIPVVGKEHNFNIKYQELCDAIIYYGIFINKIELHPKSPYDYSEDTFGIIK